MEMPDSFAELQRREGCIAVTDSWERMAGVACRDCEVSGFLFLVFVALLGFPPLTPLLLRPLHLSIRLSRFLWYFWAGVKAEWVKEDEVGGSGETAMKGTGEAEVEVELVTEVTEAGVAGEVEAVVERSPSRSKLEECEIREGSEEGEIVESEPEECAVHQRGGWIGRGRLRRCRRGTERVRVPRLEVFFLCFPFIISSMIYLLFPFFLSFGERARGRGMGGSGRVVGGSGKDIC